MFDIKPNMIVKHFKREMSDVSKNPMIYLYKIIGVGINSETNEKMVVYKSLYFSDDKPIGQIYCRPYDMFFSKVDKEKYPNIKQEYRFEPVEKTLYNN